MTTYQTSGESWENDGNVYQIVEEWDDNETPNDKEDDFMIQQISKTLLFAHTDLIPKNLMIKFKNALQRISDLESRVDALENP